VVALPAVKSEKPPPLRVIDPPPAFCLQNTPLILPVAGAPLAFSTNLLHDMALHLESKSGPGIDLPATADAVRGGYVVDTQPLAAIEGARTVTEGVLRGYWGFDPFTGPVFKLQNAHSVAWTIPQAETASLAADREYTFYLHADAAACVNQVTIKHPPGSEVKTNWIAAKPDEVEVKVPAGNATPGTLTLVVAQTGLKQPDEINISFYAETGHLDQFVIVPEDQQATLYGSRLDEVASIVVNGVHFTHPTSVIGQRGLVFTAENANATASLSSDAKLVAHVTIKDGRTLEVPATVESPRPSVNLLSKRVELGSASTASAIHLTNPDELPLDGRISFSLKTGMPKVFPRGERIEISTEDDSLRVMLNIADGSLTLQDPHTVLATLDPAKSFGNSAFGPLRFRPVDERGVQGDWKPLATLVRVPSLKELRCPEDATQQCTLTGTNLFLLDSVAADPEFTNSVSVPEGFVDSVLNVPHPASPTLYVKLRDNPKDVNTATLPLSPDKLPH
jgi:hypothetical protein